LPRIGWKLVNGYDSIELFWCYWAILGAFVAERESAALSLQLFVINNYIKYNKLLVLSFVFPCDFVQVKEKHGFEFIIIAN
jgi:hypothetical protein